MQWNKWTDVNHAHTRVFAFVVAHVQLTYACFDESDGSRHDSLWRTCKRDDRSMVIVVGLDTQHRATGDVPHGVNDSLDRFDVPSLGNVGYALDQF